MTGVKPKEKDLYDGKRDYSTESTWVYKVPQYMSILLAKNPSLTKMMEENRVLFASFDLTVTAVVW